MTYERTVSAALAETNSKFALAEALALDIPQRSSGPTPQNENDVSTYLEDARQSIIDAGGEPRSVTTLRNYRWTALWVRTDIGANFLWIPGVSFSAHSEARAAGMSYEELAGLPKPSVVAIREQTGRSGYSYGSPDHKVDVVKEALADPKVAEKVFEDPAAKTRALKAINHTNQPADPRPAPPAPPSGPTKLDVLVLLGNAKDSIRRAFKTALSLGLAGDDETLSDLGDVETEAEQFRKYLTGMGVDEAIEKIMEEI